MSISGKMASKSSKGKEQKVNCSTRSNKMEEIELLEVKRAYETNNSLVSVTVSSNTSGVSGTQVPIQPTNNCTVGASSVATNISLDYHEEFHGQNRESMCKDDGLSKQPGQVEKDLMGCDSEKSSSVSHSVGNVIEGNSEARFIKFKALDRTGT